MRIRLIFDHNWFGLYQVPAEGNPVPVFLGNLREFEDVNTCMGLVPPTGDVTRSLVFRARFGHVKEVANRPKLGRDSTPASTRESAPKPERGIFHVGPLVIPDENEVDKLPLNVKIANRSHWLHTNIVILRIWNAAIYNNDPAVAEDMKRVRAV